MDILLCFPGPIAASFNPELIEKSFALIAEETEFRRYILDFCTHAGYCERSQMGALLPKALAKIHI